VCVVQKPFILSRSADFAFCGIVFSFFLEQEEAKKDKSIKTYQNSTVWKRLGDQSFLHLIA